MFKNGTTSVPVKTKTMENHSELYRVIDGVANYSFNRCVAFLEEKGKATYGDHFRVAPEDRPVIFKLLVYMIRDQENCKKHHIDPNKGILLSGPVGCGKTSLMHLLRFFCPQGKSHIVKPAREVAFEFIRNGYETIQR